jgi:hypothetical protein
MENATPPPDTVEVWKNEEKGSDVNLALHVLNDAWLDAYDCVHFAAPGWRCRCADLIQPLKYAARWVEVGSALAATAVAVGSLFGLIMALLFLDWRFWLLYLAGTIFFGALARNRFRQLRNKDGGSKS